MKILLVENNPSDQEALIRVLKKHDESHEIMSSTTLAGATQLLKSESFHCVILDYILDDGTGLELLQHCPSTPVIFVSGSGTEDTIVKAMRGGACDYLIKDLSLQYLKLLGTTIDSVMVRKKNKVRAELYLKELESRNRKLEEYGHTVAHTLQEPLRKIKYFLEMLGPDSKSTKKEKPDFYVRARDATERLQRYIDDLLQFSKIGSTKNPMVRVDLNRLLDEVIDELEEKIEQTGISIRHEPLPVVNSHPYLMRQLFSNIIKNSLKFSRQNVKPELTISCSSPLPESTVISFCDNGIGFDNNYADQVLDPFERLDQFDPQEGSGMGLAICKKIIELHNGTIEVKSALNQGTTILISLPDTLINSVKNEEGA